MGSFDPTAFSRTLLAEALYYEENFGLVGSVSLVDLDERREAYLASFDPEEGQFVIERATQWEQAEELNLEYTLASDGNLMGAFERAEDAATQLLDLAKREELTPRFHLLYEDTDQ